MCPTPALAVLMMIIVTEWVAALRLPRRCHGTWVFRPAGTRGTVYGALPAWFHCLVWYRRRTAQFASNCTAADSEYRNVERPCSLDDAMIISEARDEVTIAKLHS
jgi:hypothetical protein